MTGSRKCNLLNGLPPATWLEVNLNDQARASYPEIKKKNPFKSTQFQQKWVESLRVDLNNVSAGTLVTMPRSGTVFHVFKDTCPWNGWGGRIILKLDEPVEAASFLLLGHLEKDTLPTVGIRFKLGDVVAKIGNTMGNGGWFEHLHVQLSMDAFLERFKDDLNALDGYALTDEEKLHDEHMNTALETIVGSSAGAIVGALYAVGLSPKTILNALLSLDRGKVFRFDNADSFLEDFGLDDGKYFMAHMADIYLRNNTDPRITFRDVYKRYKKRLIVTGTNTSAHKPEYFSMDTAPDMRVLDAVRISMSIPLLFTAVRMDDSIMPNTYNQPVSIAIPIGSTSVTSLAVGNNTVSPAFSVAGSGIVSSIVNSASATTQTSLTIGNTINGTTGYVGLDGTGLQNFTQDALTLFVNNGKAIQLLTSATVQVNAPIIMTNASLYAAPTFTTRSTGTKLVLYGGGVSSTSAEFAIGIEGGAMWYTVPTAPNVFKWYGGITLLATLSGASGLTVYDANGVRTAAADGALITKAWDLFTSGKYYSATGPMGCWGLFMEPSTLTLGGRNASGKSFQVVGYNPDSTYVQRMSIDLSTGATVFSGNVAMAGSSLTFTANSPSIAGNGTTGPFTIDPNYTTNNYVRIFDRLSVSGTLDITGDYINVGTGTANVPVGLMHEVGGNTPLIEMNVNLFAMPIGTVNTTYVGAMFRLDGRQNSVGTQLFQWLTRAPGTTGTIIAASMDYAGNMIYNGNLVVGNGQNIGTLTLGNQAGNPGGVVSGDPHHSTYYRYNYAGVVNKVATYAYSDIEFYNNGVIAAQTLKMSIAASGLVTMTGNASVAGTLQTGNRIFGYGPVNGIVVGHTVEASISFQGNLTNTYGTGSQTGWAVGNGTGGVGLGNFGIYNNTSGSVFEAYYADGSIRLKSTAAAALNVAGGVSIASTLTVGAGTATPITIFANSRAGVPTANYVTLDLPGTGTLYVWDNFETFGTITCGGSLNVAGALTVNVMNTLKWGNVLWESLFFIAAGYDVNETDKKIKDPKYKNYFKSIGDVLPCRYCRESYEVFYDSMDIQAYLDMPSCGLIRFVYDMKNLVNAKLVAQEKKLLDEEYAKILDGKSPDDPAVVRAMQDAKARICYTKAAPPFEDVVAELLQHRAGCSPVTKTCRAPVKDGTGNVTPQFPTPPKMPELAINKFLERARQVAAVNEIQDENREQLAKVIVAFIDKTFNLYLGINP
ncbi:hypothetical protein HDU87_000480 [Geranomyces variabilis]|uniref:Sulfhydryl oxidase n=1 Tax=Geranomyces variabilis TaxID=109894 RepID=A0AAD5TCV1_9FUNG|nr:hypothetical protein HDU87_000480 [Geranomyces variabilis]